MILFWHNQRYPFPLQRLGFRASRNINRAWEEANKIRRLLINAGNYRGRDVKLLAFGVAGSWPAFASEYRIKISAEDKVLRAALQEIERRK